MKGDKKMKKWEEIKKDLLKDSDFKKEVKLLEAEYLIISQIIKARTEQNITQKELAVKAGTKQSNISRLERGNYNPTLEFLKKIAFGLGKTLHVSID